MKTKILILFAALVFSCNKKNREVAPDEAYCIYEHISTSQKVFISCEKSETEAKNKCVQLRNSGHPSVESVKKSTCSDC